MNKNRRILITGGTGFIGKALSNYLSIKGFDVTVISRQNNYVEDSRYLFIPNVKSIDDLEKVFIKNDFDSIVHLATFYCHAPLLHEVDKIIEANLKFGTQVLELANKYNCKNFLNVTTGAEFRTGGSVQPNSLYATTKSLFRNLLSYYEFNHDFEVINFALYDNYGANDERKKVIDLLITQLNTSQFIDMSPGGQILYPIHIDDTLTAFEIALTSFHEFSSQVSPNNVYCIAPNNGISLKGLGCLIEKISGKTIAVNWGALPYRQNENMKPWVGDRLPNWSEKISLESGIKLLIFGE